MKIAAIDVETTGLHPKNADVIQIGALIRINNKIVDELNIRCQPIKWKTISKRALEVNNTKYEDLKTFQKPKEAWQQFFAFLEKHFNGKKYIFSGQNTPFDWKFMEDWWNTNKDDSALPFSAFFKKHHLDLMTVTSSFMANNLIDLPNKKLETVIEALDIEVEGNLHDALTDIKGTDAALIEYVHRVDKLKKDNPSHPVAVRFERLLKLI